MARNGNAKGMKETKFKDTELGKIPEDWDVCNLGSIGVPLMCKRIMKWQTNETAGVPFYKIGTFGKQADAFIAPDVWRYMITHFNYPRKGDILISAAGTIGRTVVFDGQPSYFQDSNIVWINNDEQKVLNPYLEYAYTKVAWSTDASTISRLYNSNLKSALILFPHNKAEQQRIASALSDADALVAELDALIEKKRAIMAGTMQELLTGKRRLKGFSDPWVNVELSSIGTFIGGGTPSTSNANYWNGKMPWISSADISKGKLNSLCISRRITDAAILNSATKRCPKGTLLIVSRVGVGKIDIAPCEVCTSQDFTNLVVDECHCDIFIAYRLIPILEYKGKEAQGTSIQGISSKEVKRLGITIPASLAEQRAIASILSDMDAEIAELEAKRDKYKEVRQGMMQQLLTGKIRLI